MAKKVICILRQMRQNLACGNTGLLWAKRENAWKLDKREVLSEQQAGGEMKPLAALFLSKKDKKPNI